MVALVLLLLLLVLLFGGLGLFVAKAFFIALGGAPDCEPHRRRRCDAAALTTVR